MKNDLQEIINIIVPVIVLGFGIFGLFTEKISDEWASTLIISGGLSTGLTINKK